MSDFTTYANKTTAVRGLTRYLGVAARNAPDLDINSLLEEIDGRWGFVHSKADAAVKLDEVSEEDENLILSCGHSHCPECGIHLSNGLTDFDGMADSNDRGEKEAFKVMQHEWMCLGCNAQWGAPVVLKGAKARKEPTRHYTNKSTIDGAVSASHAIFDANPDARRKDAIQLAVDAGIAFYTARTQYQKWFVAQKTRRAK